VLLQDHGRTKYGYDDVLASSSLSPSSSVADGWRGLAAEHRHHPRGELPNFQPHHMEIGVATARHPDCIVSRTGEGLRQRTPVEAGMIWLCPVGVTETDITISAWHDVLHLYVPHERFAQLSDAQGGAAVKPESVRYLGGFYDERIRLVGRSLLHHLNAPVSAGAVLLDELALELTRCLADNYACATGAREAAHGLDGTRVRRVLDYMAAHIEDDIGLDELARAACLSVFHFNRMFTQTMGMPPHRYLGRLRLERAKALLSSREMSISELALACCFSSQSNFTRAFRRTTGTTPMAYRRLTS
jgi:AraC family transcriptional regulator